MKMVILSLRIMEASTKLMNGRKRKFLQVRMTRDLLGMDFILEIKDMHRDMIKDF